MQLSILIPSKNEKYLERTVQDILEHSECDTEILVGLDGEEGTRTHDGRVTYFRRGQLGQRALTNYLAKNAKANYVMKVDAHCSFSQGFDRVMLEDITPHTILAPYLFILNAEEWAIKSKPASSSYCFDTNMVFQYNRRDENTADVNETMCLQGSAWMVHKYDYWEWNLCDESLGSWGSQGVELGVQAFLNGGVCKTTKRAYYGHLFRESDTDFPYERDKPQMRHANAEVKRRYMTERLAPLIAKFNYPADWTEELVHTLLFSRT